MAVVNNLKEIRESQGLLQEDLASATGFCTKTIGRVERGERAPSAEFMLRIAAYFNLLVEDVFKLEEHRLWSVFFLFEYTNIYLFIYSIYYLFYTS